MKHRSISFVKVLLIIIFPVTVVSKTSETEALLQLRQSFSNATALESWKPGTDPCNEEGDWIGIVCENGLVSTLRLGGLGLSGKIDIDALSRLTGLRSISFISNGFSGPIPDFHRIGALRGLYLSSNQFSGEIPLDYFNNMEGLKKLWLSNNKFSGPIPSSLARLSHLMEFHIDNNQFSGNIPPLGQQGLISIDFSNNHLEGEIPPSLSKFNENAFKGNPGLCGGSMGKACDPSAKSSYQTDITPSPPYNEPKPSIGLVSGFVVVMSLTLIVTLAAKRRRDDSFSIMSDRESISFSESSVGNKDFDTRSEDFGPAAQRLASGRKGSRNGRRPGLDIVMINEDKAAFGLTDLMKSAAEVLGNGVLGSSYKATMASGLTVVVKRVKEMNKVGREDFDLMIRRFGRLNHRNVLPPIAYHYRKDEKLLILEFQPKRSLLHVLHGDRGIARAELNWPVRLKMVHGIAIGLSYLHDELPTLDLPHGNLKSSNVLLTSELEPLLVDYGFGSLISAGQAAQTLTAYKSPEAVAYQQISPKCDVYCLGLMILEVITGTLPCQFVHNGEEGGTDLVQWLRSAIGEGREADLINRDIASANSCLNEIVQLLHVAAACTENRPEQRLDVREAIRRIESIQTQGSYQDMTPSLL